MSDSKNRELYGFKRNLESNINDELNVGGG